MKTALIAGSTGLIGKQLLTLVLATNRYDKVIALTRTDLDVNNPKLVEIKVDFSNLDQYAEKIKCDDVYCCLGTTIAKAKTKEKFYEVDFTFSLRVAIAAKLGGASQCMLVSALGASKNSSVYYNRVKGELEDAVTNLGYNSLHIFRPSLLLGAREEKRAGEEAAKSFFKYLGFLVPLKYKGIEATKVARSMLHYAALELQGKHIHHSDEFHKF